jgi:hypothetical protein
VRWIGLWGSVIAIHLECLGVDVDRLGGPKAEQLRLFNEPQLDRRVAYHPVDLLMA